MIMGSFFDRNISVLLLGLCVLSSLWVLGFDIGPYSLRVYLYLILCGLMTYEILRHKKTVFISKDTRKIFLLYMLLVSWIFVVDLIKGKEIYGLTHFILSTHGIALVGFVTVQFFVRRQEDVLFLAKALILAVSVSAFFCVMQFFEVKTFSDLADIMNPAFLDPSSGDRGGYKPGLAFYSIALTYHIITLGALALALLYLFEPSDSGKYRLFGITMLVSLLFLTILITRSRSAALAIILSIAFFFWCGVSESFQKGFPRKRVYWVTPLLCLILLVEFGILNKYEVGSWEVKTSSYEHGGLGRLVNFEDPLRLAAIKTSLLIFLQGNLLIGNDMKFYEEAFPEHFRKRGQVIGAHNMMVNALVRYGLIGLFLLLWFLFVIVDTCRVGLKKQLGVHDLRWVIYGCVVGIIANAFNSLFHNDSYLFGTFVPWWIIGILCSVIEITRRRERGKVGVSTYVNI